MLYIGVKWTQQRLKEQCTKSIKQKACPLGKKNARLTNLSKEKKRPECNKICNKVRYKNGGYYRLQWNPENH